MYQHVILSVARLRIQKQHVLSSHDKAIAIPLKLHGNMWCYHPVYRYVHHSPNQYCLTRVMKRRSTNVSIYYFWRSGVNVALGIMPFLSCASWLEWLRRHSFLELSSFFHDGIVAQYLRTIYPEISLGTSAMNWGTAQHFWLAVAQLVMLSVLLQRREFWQV